MYSYIFLYFFRQNSTFVIFQTKQHLDHLHGEKKIFASGSDYFHVTQILSRWILTHEFMTHFVVSQKKPWRWDCGFFGQYKNLGADYYYYYHYYYYL